MTSWKQVVALAGCVALVAFMLLGFLTVGEFLAASGVWLTAFALFGADIAEINLGTILGIKRDVRAAREIREQIEKQAQEIRAVRDQVAQTENRVIAQAESISLTSQRVAQSEAEVMQTRQRLERLGARLYETSLLIYFAREIDTVVGLSSDDPLMSRWLETLEEVRELSDLSDAKAGRFIGELSDIIDEVYEHCDDSQQ